MKCVISDDDGEKHDEGRSELGIRTDWKEKKRGMQRKVQIYTKLSASASVALIAKHFER